jgi:uracil-DNA glycosylase
MGLCFSVPKGKKINPSLTNIFKEIASDTGDCKGRQHGDLTGWAKQGLGIYIYLYTKESFS